MRMIEVMGERTGSLSNYFLRGVGEWETGLGFEWGIQWVRIGNYNEAKVCNEAEVYHVFFIMNIIPYQEFIQQILIVFRIHNFLI
jgi:hypothetical protein